MKAASVSTHAPSNFGAPAGLGPPLVTVALRSLRGPKAVETLDGPNFA
jgi:hypothetical protein